MPHFKNHNYNQYYTENYEQFSTDGYKQLPLNNLKPQNIFNQDPSTVQHAQTMNTPPHVMFNQHHPPIHNKQAMNTGNSYNSNMFHQSPVVPQPGSTKNPLGFHQSLDSMMKIIQNLTQKMDTLTNKVNIMNNLNLA